MKLLNENTRRGLKSLTTVGNAAIVRYPWTSVLQKNKSIIAFINLEEYGEESFEEFGLEETLSEFLSLIDFYQDPDITAEGNIITIESGKQVQHYETSDLDSMRSFDIPVTALENVSKTPEIINFEISASELSRLKKISSITKATSLIVGGKVDGESTITVCRLDRNNNISNDSVSEYPISSTEDTSVVFDIMNISKLPEKNYQVSIKKSATSGNGVSVWTVDDEPIKIIVSVSDIF